MKKQKAFKLQPHEIAPVALGRGGCLATDRIVVDGRPVGYMYREQPVRELDSGWRFFAGDEDEAYMSEAGYHDVYDINTIVNYDPTILQHLDAAIGSRFERQGGQIFVQLKDDE